MAFYLSKVIVSSTYTNSISLPDPQSFQVFNQTLRATREISWYDEDSLYEYIGKPSDKLNVLRLRGLVNDSIAERSLELCFLSAERYWLFDGRGHRWKVRMSRLQCDGGRQGRFGYSAEFFVYERETCDSVSLS